MNLDSSNKEIKTAPHTTTVWLVKCQKCFTETQFVEYQKIIERYSKWYVIGTIWNDQIQQYRMLSAIACAKKSSSKWGGSDYIRPDKYFDVICIPESIQDKIAEIESFKGKAPASKASEASEDDGGGDKYLFYEYNEFQRPKRYRPTVLSDVAGPVNYFDTDKKLEMKTLDMLTAKDLNEKTPQDIERQTRDMPAAEARKICKYKQDLDTFSKYAKQLGKKQQEKEARETLEFEHDDFYPFQKDILEIASSPFKGEESQERYEKCVHFICDVHEDEDGYSGHNGKSELAVFLNKKKILKPKYPCNYFQTFSSASPEVFHTIHHKANTFIFDIPRKESIPERLPYETFERIISGSWMSTKYEGKNPSLTNTTKQQVFVFCNCYPSLSNSLSIEKIRLYTINKNTKELITHRREELFSLLSNYSSPSLPLSNKNNIHSLKPIDEEVKPSFYHPIFVQQFLGKNVNYQMSLLKNQFRDLKEENIQLKKQLILYTSQDDDMKEMRIQEEKEMFIELNKTKKVKTDEKID